MMLIIVFAWAIGAPLALDDPDRLRSVPEGVEVFMPGTVEAEKTYSAFVIGFPDRPGTFVSPSRYAVMYLEGLLPCSNAAEAGMGSVRDGRWWSVVFTVHAIKETAVETPIGSGVWAWRTEYDCTITSLSPAR